MYDLTPLNFTLDHPHRQLHFSLVHQAENVNEYKCRSLCEFSHLALHADDKLNTWTQVYHTGTTWSQIWQ